MNKLTEKILIKEIETGITPCLMTTEEQDIRPVLKILQQHYKHLTILQCHTTQTLLQKNITSDPLTGSKSVTKEPTGILSTAINRAMADRDQIHILLFKDANRNAFCFRMATDRTAGSISFPPNLRTIIFVDPKARFPDASELSRVAVFQPTLFS